MINKIYTWFTSLNVNVKVIIGSWAMMLFGYIVVNLFDLIFFGSANW